jgi:hypothetical protein
MKPKGDPTIVSLETHRRRRVAETREKSVRARKARAAAAVRGERAINWRRAPIALAVLALLLLLSWLIGRVAG